jgi:Fic family protein
MFKPVYNISPSILSGISEIAEIKAIVERSKVLPLNEAQLRRQALVRMTHTSTSIEGNKLAEFQVDRVLSGMSVNADQKSIQEVKNYQEALKLIDQMGQEKAALTIDKVLKIHALLMQKLLPEEKIGHFRSGSIYVVDDLGDGREHLRYEGPDAKKVAFLVNELILWLAHAEKERVHPVIIAGIFHLQFVTIHPFSDGNGRISRLLATYILIKFGWDFRKILVLEDYYNRDRLAYYNAENVIQGNKYHEGEDCTSWLEYFVEGFLVEARKVAELIQSIGYGKISESSEQVFLDRDEIKIMDFLTTTGKLTSKDVQEVLGIAKRTSQLKLKGLLEKGLITAQGAGPSTYYILAG